MTTIPELNQKLKMTRGDTPSWQGQVVDPDNSDLPKDITGCTLTFTAKRDVDDADSAAVIQKTVGNGITLPPGNHAGIFTLGPLLPADTQSLPNENIGLVFDIEMVLGGNVSTVAKGVLYVDAEATQS